jgi:hypothetical protein
MRLGGFAAVTFGHWRVADTYVHCFLSIRRPVLSKSESHRQTPCSSGTDLRRQSGARKAEISAGPAVGTLRVGPSLGKGPARRLIARPKMEIRWR